MKLLVNLVQFIIVIAIVYPILSFWDRDRVEKFCRTVESGMSRQEFLNQADKSWMKIVKPNDMEGQWKIKVVTYSPYNNIQCVVNGLGNRVGEAWMEIDK